MVSAGLGTTRANDTIQIPTLSDGTSLAQVELGMHDACPGAHYLDVARAGAPFITHRIAMADGAGANVGDDFHVTVGMRRKAALGGDPVIVPDANAPPAHARRIVIIGEAEMVAGIEPAVVGVAQRSEGSDVDHERKDGRGPLALSSVTDVTGIRGGTGRNALPFRHNAQPTTPDPSIPAQ